MYNSKIPAVLLTRSDNPNENRLYSYDTMFLSKGLTDDNIKSMFDDSKILITWTDKKGNEEKKKINLTDIIDFK